LYYWIEAFDATSSEYPTVPIGPPITALKPCIALDAGAIPDDETFIVYFLVTFEAAGA